MAVPPPPAPAGVKGLSQRLGLGIEGHKYGFRLTAGKGGLWRKVGVGPAVTLFPSCVTWSKFPDLSGLVPSGCEN